ncbi:hypothetical protein TNCV_4015071 [Trichonephila clavipes]|uniref:Uncharacterized protein n=1 Tax=Trichonephila clavipes TaxID=2585209 RepID=A0A8X6V365_TRICX|nr:hypothetical protein TNCV_4015071 [Trichonephila clavipes]
MKTSSVEFISRSPTPSPMERNYRRPCLFRPFCMFQILLWSLWTYRCGQRTVRLADCGSQSQAVFARRRSKSKLKLLDIRAELERRENARGARAGVTF